MLSVLDVKIGLLYLTESALYKKVLEQKVPSVAIPGHWLIGLFKAPGSVSPAHCHLRRLGRSDRFLGAKFRKSDVIDGNQPEQYEKSSSSSA